MPIQYPANPMRAFLEGGPPFVFIQPINQCDIDGALSVIKFQMGIDDAHGLLAVIMSSQGVLTQEIELLLKLMKI